MWRTHLPADGCDGLDNDCDGSTDEDLMRACGMAVGNCPAGVQICDAGRWGECQTSGGGSAELCDGLDNDCDGRVDENVGRTCGSNVGACSTGIQSCSGGSYGGCQGSIGPQNEACDRIDNDCDGRMKASQVWIVIDSVLVGRSANGDWGACGGSYSGPTPEANDCDVTTDEAVSQSCGTNTGREAVELKHSNGDWGACRETTWLQPMRPVMALMMIAMAEQMKALRVPVGTILGVVPMTRRVMTAPGVHVTITSVQVKRRVMLKMIAMVGPTKGFADRVVASRRMHAGDSTPVSCACIGGVQPVQEGTTAIRVISKIMTVMVWLMKAL